MKQFLIKDDITNGIRELGIQAGMSIEVHSSLSSFGYIDGGADTVITALQETITCEGSIVMPAFRHSKRYPLDKKDKALGITCKIRILDEFESSSGMGIIADTFRTKPDVTVGQGIFRVSAWGTEAELHAHGFQKIIDEGGWAVLLGVDIYSLSSMHYVEHLLPMEIRKRSQVSEKARTIYPENQWHVESWAPECLPWYKIQAEGLRRGMIKESIIGKAKCMLVNVGEVVGLYEKALRDDPFGFYEIDILK